MKHVKDGQPTKVMQFLHQMQPKEMSCDKFTIIQVVNSCTGLGTLEIQGLFMNGSFKVAFSLMSLWGVAWWTFMQSVGAFRMLGECSTGCHLEMWSLGMPLY
jgi:hypothetical protein